MTEETPIPNTPIEPVQRVTWTIPSNPGAVYTRPDEREITLDVEFAGLGRLPFTARADDATAHGRAIFAILTDPSSGIPIGAYVAPPPEIPFRVTRAQAKIALHRAGLLAQVQAIVVESDDVELALWWSEAGTWERTNSYVQALGARLGLDSQAVDNLFRSAASIA